jgi:hypothetical protein
MLRTGGVLILVGGLSLSGASNVFGSALEVFSIGRKDRSFAEFARERDPGRPVIYRVGDSSPAKDWYAYQPGSFDYQVGRSSMEQDWVVMNPGSSGSLAKDPAPVPFEIVFSLPSTPKGAFSLHLDAIFRYRRRAALRRGDQWEVGKLPTGATTRAGAVVATGRGSGRGASIHWLRVLRDAITRFLFPTRKQQADDAVSGWIWHFLRPHLSNQRTGKESPFGGGSVGRADHIVQEPKFRIGRDGKGLDPHGQASRPRQSKGCGWSDSTRE